MDGSDQLRSRAWAAHEREQLIRLAHLPLAQKLQWLEEADRLVRQLKSQTGQSRVQGSHDRRTAS
jgi:hypothetical protein